MIRRQFITVFYLLFLIPAFAQEGLRPLTGRINCINEEKVHSKLTLPNAANKTMAVSLQIPFFDDFYYAATSEYPDMNLWSDSMAYVNTGFPIAAPSIGVATFDGLNKSGYPYTPNLTSLTQSFPADTLTSRPLDLHIVAAGSRTLFPSDSVALSFRYQARGNGEAPEITDSLLLDFFVPATNKWIKVWGKPGNLNGNINEPYFKKAYVKIDSAKYLADGFKFRFRNKATTAGDFDHWHVDYVYLNRNRTIADTIFNDITFGGMPASLLHKYTAMPYQQYILAEKDTIFSMKIKNNNNSSVPLNYFNNQYLLPLPPAAPVYAGSSDGGNYQLPPTGNGVSTYTNQSMPTFTYAFPPMTDSTDFMIKHYLFRSVANPTTTTSDFYTANDTLIQYQRFRNYYALDDGGAEAGYYVNGIGGQMAVKIGLNFKDTLRALRIYFDPVGYVPAAITAYSFVINVWDNGGSGPGSAIYTDVVSMLPKYYTTGSREYPEYKLSAPKVLPAGIYYIGIQQRVATGITVGYDLNTDHSSSVYYNSGSGWQQSTLGGSLMIRPVFGAFVPTPVGIKENSVVTNRSFFAYPNPASDELIIHCDKTENVSYFLMNTLGQKLKEENISFNDHSINTNDLSSGVYFLVIKENNRLVQQQKILIQH